MKHEAARGGHSWQAVASLKQIRADAFMTPPPLLCVASPLWYETPTTRLQTLVLLTRPKSDGSFCKHLALRLVNSPAQSQR